MREKHPKSVLEAKNRCPSGDWVAPGSLLPVLDLDLGNRSADNLEDMVYPGQEPMYPHPPMEMGDTLPTHVLPSLALLLSPRTTNTWPVEYLIWL